MKLWTFQNSKSVDELLKTGTLVAKWERYKDMPNWENAYRWMASQMIQRKINCSKNAPIWAWHSCNTYQKAPTLDDARALLSDFEIETGIKVVEFECPDDIALLSFYSIWNDILDLFIQGNQAISLKKNTFETLFDVRSSTFKKGDSIQATLPFLKKEWIIEIRELNSASNPFKCSPTKLV